MQTATFKLQATKKTSDCPPKLHSKTSCQIEISTRADISGTDSNFMATTTPNKGRQVKNTSFDGIQSITIAKMVVSHFLCFQANECHCHPKCLERTEPPYHILEDSEGSGFYSILFSNEAAAEELPANIIACDFSPKGFSWLVCAAASNPPRK
jgi:hypothetical protein